MIKALALALALAVLPGAASAQEGSGAIGWIRGVLGEAASSNSCGANAAAARGTLERLGGLELPSSGKVLVVNIPSGVVTAYEDGVPVIESRAVVGKPSTPTPELDTHVTFVRPNPTWTVPESILKAKRWREKLADDPFFFEENGFDVVVDGQTLSPDEAAPYAASATAFVQRPGPINALGLLKIGLSNSDGVYLHDTNDPGRFESEVRAASAGCVRMERVRDIGAWVLDVNPSDMDAMIDGGDVENHEPPEPVKVIIGYWTAWPDANGRLRYYPDIYGLDGGSRCSSSSDDGGYADEGPADPVWTEYEAR